MTALSRDYFNRQEQTYSRLAPHQGWSQDDVENFGKRANTDLKAWHHPSIAHDTLPNRELDEQWPLKKYGLDVHMRTAIDGTGCEYALALLTKLSHKCVPMASTFFLSKVAYYLQLFGKETRSTRVEHLEALLYELKPKKRHFGDNKQ